MEAIGPQLLLFALAGGFLFLQVCHFFKHRWDALEWDRNTFEAALAGGLLFVLVRALVPFLKKSGQLCALRDWIHGVIPFPFSATFVGALGVGGALALVLNWFIPRDVAIRHAVQRHGGELLILLQQAARAGAAVSLTMTNRKVYVGFVLSPPSPRYPYTKLLPTVSGHRLQDSMQFKLTTPYWHVYEDILRRRDRGETLSVTSEDFGVVLPVAEICSANLFDNDSYARYFRPELARPPEPA